LKRVEMLYLSQEDILDMEIPLREIIPLVETGLREHGLGQVENPPKPGIHAKSDSFIHAMPAYYRKLGIGGIKWVSGYPSNRELGLPQILGVMITNDMETGVPTSIMDCRWITAVRTAAVSAITAKFCASKGSTTLGVIGCGVQGRMTLGALKEIVPTLSKVKVYDINPEASKRYKADLEKETGIEITPVKNVEGAANGSDLILTATQRLPNPLVKNEWFKPGALGMGLEASRAWYGDAILKADKFVTDSWEQTEHFHDQGAFPEGMPKLYAELGEIVAGKKKGRDNQKERILAINIGLALEDVIVADYIYKKAEKAGDYKKLTLMERDF
jgi:ornithine cyclodeaminase/alanine dehydrogenase-like protein (mu-crystallin family)